MLVLSISIPSLKEETRQGRAQVWTAARLQKWQALISADPLYRHPLGPQPLSASSAITHTCGIHTRRARACCLRLLCIIFILILCTKLWFMMQQSQLVVVLVSHYLLNSSCFRGLVKAEDYTTNMYIFSPLIFKPCSEYQCYDNRSNYDFSDKHRQKSLIFSEHLRDWIFVAPNFTFWFSLISTLSTSSNWLFSVK